uniref:Uncharacterized protein n=1 Tax=Arundo donax TaxID=35708 RepID=A0A0A8Z3C5_ARUDO
MVFIAQFTFLLCFKQSVSQCLSPQKEVTFFEKESKKNLVEQLAKWSPHRAFDVS